MRRRKSVVSSPGHFPAPDFLQIGDHVFKLACRELSLAENAERTQIGVVKEDRMKKLYLVLAIVGAVLPYAFFIQHFSSEGVSLMAFLAAVFANPAAGGFTADLLFTSMVFWMFMFHQRSREKGPRPILFIVLNLLIGLSCALPAYLYARERSGVAA